MEQWIETPDIYLGKNANRMLLDASMAEMSSNSEFKVQVTNDGKTYKDLAVYNSENATELNDGKLKRYKFYDYAGEKVRFRIWLKAYGRTEVAINSMVVEAVPDCDYPVDLKVESVVGSTAKVAWTPQGEEDHWQVSWKKSDSAGIYELARTLCPPDTAVAYEEDSSRALDLASASAGAVLVAGSFYLAALYRRLEEC